MTERQKTVLKKVGDTTQNIAEEAANTTKHFAKEVVRSFVTDEILWENEIRANLLTANILIVCTVVLALSFVLNKIGVFQIDTAALGTLVNMGCIVLLVPAVLCTVFKGRKKWLKIVMLLALIVACGATDVLLTYRVGILMALPVILSARYFYRRLTVGVAAVSTVVFGVTASKGVYYGILDLNFITVQPGTDLHISTSLYDAIQNIGISLKDQEHIMLIRSFMPKFMIFVVIALVSISIAKWGYDMILDQDARTKTYSRVETELDVAKNIQMRALPIVHVLKEHPEFDLAAKMTPAKEVGGDFYDFFYVDPTHLALTIADVSGKGVPAALFMMVSKILLDNSIEGQMKPGMILAEVNHQLCEKNLEDMFVTVWLGILDLETGHMVTANAGHEYPLICRKEGKFEIFHDKHGLVLGAMDGVRYKECELDLYPGDTMFLYTDGVPEANDVMNAQYGISRTMEALDHLKGKSMVDMIDGLQDDINAFVGDVEQFDDTTMLAFHLNKYLQKEGYTVVPTPGSIQDVQAYVEGILEKEEIPLKFTTKVNIAVDEIFSNIVNYSGAAWANVNCKVEDQTIKIVMQDNGMPYNPLAKDDPDIALGLDEREIGGLGIFLTKKLMSRIDYQYVDGVNTVSMEMDIK